MLFVLAFLLFMSAVDKERKSDDCEIVGILKYFFSLYHEATALLIHEVSRSHTTKHRSR
jgi:hypothetical protein